MDPDEEYEFVVIDNGASIIRSGFAGDDSARSFIPNELVYFNGEEIIREN